MTNDSTISSDRRKTSEAGENDPTALAADPPRRRPGRPPVYDEKWTKVTVVLFDRQIAYLDELTGSMRARNGTAVKSTVLSKLST